MSEILADALLILGCVAIVCGTLLASELISELILKIMATFFLFAS